MISCKVALVTYLIQQPDQYITKTFVSPSTDLKLSQTEILYSCIHIFNDITIKTVKEKVKCLSFFQNMPSTCCLPLQTALVWTSSLV